MTRRARTEVATEDRERFTAWLDHKRRDWARRRSDGKRPLTQKGLAELLGLPDATEVSHWKSGARTPSPEVVGRLADLFTDDESEARDVALQIQITLGQLPAGMFGLPPLEVPKDPFEERVEAIQRHLDRADLSSDIKQHLIESAKKFYRNQRS